jgi:hypothetical protein
MIAVVVRVLSQRWNAQCQQQSDWKSKHGLHHVLYDVLCKISLPYVLHREAERVCLLSDDGTAD